MNNIVFFILLIVLYSCERENIDLDTDVFYPTLHRESDFLRLGLKRLQEIDNNIYQYTVSDTIISYEFQNNLLLSVSWQFPFKSKEGLFTFFEENSILLLTESNEESKYSYLYVRNLYTRHIFKCYLDFVKNSITVSYDFPRER